MGKESELKIDTGSQNPTFHLEGFLPLESRFFKLNPIRREIGISQSLDCVCFVSEFQSEDVLW